MGSLLRGRGVHVDQHLTQMAIGYRPVGFIADMIFPTVSVPKQSDSYLIYNQADMFRQENSKRSKGTEANKIVTSISSDQFYCNNYALKESLDIEDRVNADPAFVRSLGEGRTMRIKDGLLLDWEIRAANLVTNTANVGSSTAVGSAWTDLVNSDPIGDVLTGIDNVEDATGYRPNRILFSGTAWRNFRRNTNVINKAGNPNISAGGLYPSQAAVEDLLEAKVVIGGAYKNTAQEAQAMALSRIWGDHVLVYYVPDRPSTETPAFGYSFRWTAANIANMQVERHPYDPKVKCDEIEMGYYQDEKVTSAPLGFLVTNTTSST